MVNWRGAQAKPRDHLLYHDLVSLIAHGRVQASVRDLVQPPDLLDIAFLFGPLRHTSRKLAQSIVIVI